MLLRPFILTLIPLVIAKERSGYGTLSSRSLSNSPELLDLRGIESSPAQIGWNSSLVRYSSFFPISEPCSGSEYSNK